MTEENKEQLEKYKKNGFTEAQLDEIAKGLEGGSDVSFYARKGIEPQDMAYIRKRIEFSKLVAKEKPETEDDPELIDRTYETMKKSAEITAFERAYVFAMMASGAAVVSGIYTMLMIIPEII